MFNLKKKNCLKDITQLFFLMVKKGQENYMECLEMMKIMVL